MSQLTPYAKSIPPDQNCIIICTGSEAWNRATSKGWLNGLTKTLLPLNADISGYKWDFAYHKEVLIFSNGTMETYTRLVELSRALLSYGALTVMWCIPHYPVNKFVRKEAV